MASSRKQKLRTLLFGAGFSLAFAGWLLVLEKLVETERLAGESRLRQARELALGFARDRFEERWENRHQHAVTIIESSPSTTSAIPDLLALDAFSGVLSDGDSGDATGTRLPEPELEKLRQNARTGTLEPGRFLETYASRSSVLNGRDDLAGVAVSLLENHPDHESLRAFIVDRATSRTGPPLSSAHRLFLLRSALGDDTRPHQKLIAHLEVSVQEDRSDLEIRELTVGGHPVSFLWKAGDLARLADEKKNIRFLTEPSRDSLPVSGTRTFQHIEFTGEASALPSGSRNSGLGARPLAVASGLLMLAVAVVAFVLSRRDARQADLKTELASTMAHELRTPLAGQRMVLESLMERADLSETKRSDYLGMALSENRRLSHLAEQFLIFSRAGDARAMTLRNSEIEPASLAEDVAQIAQHQWQGEEYTFELKTEPRPPTIQGDYPLICSALLNLLENAWKYSGETKEITLAVRQNENEVLFSVADRGIGIAPSDQKRIFDRYFRVDQRLARTRDGLGLGLAAVKRITDAHGGTATVESTPGDGSTFTLTFPLKTTQ